MATKTKSSSSPIGPKLNLARLRTYPLQTRRSKVNMKDGATPWRRGGAFQKFLQTLPNILAGQTFNAVVSAIVTARQRGKPVILGMGAHATKVGLNPILVDLMRKKVITTVAVNGAVIIHDFELAYQGHTSEEVEAEIDTGRFGMAEDTGCILNEAIVNGWQKGLGLGESVGRYMISHPRQFPHRRSSVLATGAQLGIPVTVHVAIGTDIIHMHPNANGEAIGGGSLEDFRKLAALVSKMEGGVYINLGSAVLLPEVFLKTVTLGRNLGRALNRITTVNMDFLPHYRPMTNVVKRPTQKGGKGFNLVGHHEIMIPLLAAAVLEELKR